jgi:hypothetical protein
VSWVVVQFAECREVFIDDQNQGDNIDAEGRLNPLLVNAGTHTFALGGAPNVAPPSQTLHVPEVPIGTPFPVVFAKAV